MWRSLALLLFGVTACGRGDVAPTTGDIMGGRPATATPADLRGTVAVNWHRPSGSTEVCSGTVIEPDVVLTAAHCVAERDPMTGAIIGRALASEMEVVAGSLMRFTTDPTQSYAVVVATAHPGFPHPIDRTDPTGLSQNDDIAVLVLARPVDTVSVVPVLPMARVDAELVAGTPLVISGYGFSEGGDGILYTGTTSFVRRSAFELFYSGTADSCSGDSGGPAYVDTTTGTFLVGVTSRGRLDATRACGEGAIDTLAPAYQTFIDSVVAGAGTDGGVPDDGGAAGDGGVPDAGAPDGGAAPGGGGCCAVAGARGADGAGARAPGSLAALGALGLAAALRRRGRRSSRS